MASSDNFEPYLTLPIPLHDTWISENYACDTEAVTKALQITLSKTTDTTTLTPYSPTSSYLETTPLPHRQLSAGGKVTKRKSRASKKKSQTTFITADVANFRQMVQQVTGVRFGGSQVCPVPLVKPEPHRPGSRFPVPAGCLPTLDTSAFLLDHNQVVVGPNPTDSMAQHDGPRSRFDYEALSSACPTLEPGKGVW